MPLVIRTKDLQALLTGKTISLPTFTSGSETQEVILDVPCEDDILIAIGLALLARHKIPIANHRVSVGALNYLAAHAIERAQQRDQ